MNKLYAFFAIFGFTALLLCFLLPGSLSKIKRTWSRFRKLALPVQLAILITLGLTIQKAGTKPESIGTPTPATLLPALNPFSTTYLSFDGGLYIPDTQTMGEEPATTPYQRMGGYVISSTLSNDVPYWVDVENAPNLYFPPEWNSSNVLARHDDAIYLNPDSCPLAMKLFGTTTVERVYWDTATALAFNSPAPGITTNLPAPGAFIGALWGSHSFIPSLGSRAWISTAPDNAVFCLSNIFIGRETNQAASVQTLWKKSRYNQSKGNDIIISYLLSSNTVASGVLTNCAIVIGNQSGGEALSFGTNQTPQAFTLTFTGFGYNPVTDTNSPTYYSSDADGDGLTDDEELLTHHSDMWNEDTDYDGLLDPDELDLNSDIGSRDSDHDSIPDGAEDPARVLIPDTIDFNNNGLPDSWELYHFGNLTAAGNSQNDSDSDGRSNLSDMLTGNSPVFSCAVAVSSTNLGENATLASWTDMSAYSVTNYTVKVSTGTTEVLNFVTNASTTAATLSGCFTEAEQTLTITALCNTNNGSKPSYTATENFRQPSEPNLTVWKICDKFAVESPATGTTILERTFTVNCVRNWGGIYISSDYQSAGEWELEGFEMEFSGDTSAASTNASPIGDSLLLDVNSDATNITVTLKTTTSNALSLCRSPLYLIKWTPEVTIDSSAQTVDTNEGRALVLVSNQSGGSTDATFTINTEGRPSNAPLTDNQLSALNDPFGDSGNNFIPQTDDNDLITGGSFTAGGTGVITLTPPGGGAAAGADGGEGGADQGNPGAAGDAELILYRISPTFEYYNEESSEDDNCECGDLTSSYPFDTLCLKKQWIYSYYSTNVCYEGGYQGVKVTLGIGPIDESKFDVTINDQEGFIYLWQDEDTLATATVALGTNEVWNSELERIDQTDRCSGYWGNGPSLDITSDGGGCGCDDGCESGSCDGNDGPDLGSLKFRLSLGSSDYKKSGGFIWFTADTMPVSITQTLFNVTVAPSVTISNISSVLYQVNNGAVNGRRITLTSLSSGVCFTIHRYDRDLHTALEGSWEVSKSGSNVSFVKKDSSGRITRNLTYRYDDVLSDTSPLKSWDDAWIETDHLTERVRILYEDRDENMPEYRISINNSSGKMYHALENHIETIGSGDAAVERVTSLYEYGKYEGWCRTYFNYHQDVLNPRVNGKLKRQDNPDGSWEYHLWDDSGRETLRVTSVEGCDVPPYLSSAENFNFSPSGNYPDLNAEITQYSYATHGEAEPSFLDAAKPRTVTEYRVQNGSPITTSRTWHKYVRSTDDVTGYDTITHTAIRAATQNSAINDAANRTSIATSFLDSNCGDIRLDGRPLTQQSEDGSTTIWDYTFGIDKGFEIIEIVSFTGTIEAPNAIEGLSTYQVETNNLYFGYNQSRETRLYRGAQEDIILSKEDSEYDSKGRLISTEFSDETSISNTWGCCSLIDSTDRSGMYAQYFPNTNPLHSASMVLSPGLLPGADGAYPISGSYVDLMGRVINSYRTVSNQAYPTQTTITEYPEHSSHFRVTTDHLGVVTTNRTSLVSEGPWNDTAYYIIDETIRAGVTTTSKRLANGEPVVTKEWTDSVSGEDLKKTTKTESEIQPNGWEKRSSYVKYNDGEWILQSETGSDFLGRTITSSRPSANSTMLTTSNVYNNAGQLVQTVNEDSSSMVYVYNELNERTATIRIGAGQTLDFNPLSFTLATVIAMDKYVVSTNSEWFEESDFGLSAQGVPSAWWQSAASISYRPGENALTTSVQRTQLTGLSLGCTSRAVVTDANSSTMMSMSSVNPASVAKTETSISFTHGSTNITRSVAGYEVSSTNSIGTAAAFEYDGFSRIKLIKNFANGRELKSVTSYHDDGSIASVGQITAAGTNTTNYSVRQAVAGAPNAYKVTVTDPGGNATVNYYSGNGQLYRSEGATYPTETVRDATGRAVELHTWRDETGNSDVTTWFYDQVTGLMTNKIYADSNGTVYDYQSDGKPSSREWARGITTTYGYTDTSTGRTHTTDYNNSTPSVTNYYNLSGQLIRVEDGTGTTTFGYDSLGRQTAETNALAVITRSYNSHGRYTGYTLNPLSIINSPLSINYGYDNQNRLSTVTSITGNDTNTFTYSCLPGSNLISGYSLSQGRAAASLTVSRAYEAERNLITAVTNSWDSTVISAFDYINDSTGKRSSRTDYYNGSTVTNDFGYNKRSEVTNAVMNSDTYSYVYDDIGNRHASSINSVDSTYTVNQLNQYTAIVGGISATLTHDTDGNLTFDGRLWHHTYDGENRLMKSEPHNAINGSVMVEYRYNHKNLRVERVIKQLDSSQPETWIKTKTHKYIWDGWNIAAEIILDHATSTTNISYYTWGLDVSGALQGAGGVGGLLCDTKVTSAGTNFFYALADANGNITEYVDDSGVVKAHAIHSAFGETEISGSMKDCFTHWFSSKPLDSETRLVQYEFRPYDTPTGKWLSRDLIGIKGGLNEFGFVGNDGVNNWDYLGMEWSIAREGERFAVAVPHHLDDTFDSLAKKVELDTKDYQEWAHTEDSKPKKCKEYKIPNTVFFHVGDKKWYGDHWALLGIKERQYDEVAASMEGIFHVKKLNNVSDNEIKAALKYKYIYRYYYTGHGAHTVINSLSNNGVMRHRYTPYGINLLMLMACQSAEKQPVANSSAFRYNDWENNVATRGWFYGYRGKTDLNTEALDWVRTRGTNTKGPYQ